MATKLQNPIKEDPVLRKLLQDLNSITSKRDFTRWKASFVERFSTFLSSDGEAAANAKRDMYQKELGRFVKIVQQLEDHIANGDLSLVEGKTTVRARKCLAEVQKHLTRVSNETENLIPGTGEQAREMGYTKFHMGAVLINDGFEEYDRLSLCADIMQRMREGVLAKVADKQLLEEMENYVDKFDMFCDIMADLGLLQAMRKCRELLHLPDEPESEPKPEPEPGVVEDETEGSIEAPLSPIKKSAEFNTSYKQDDGSGRLEMTTMLEGSGTFDGENSKSFALGFPGIKPPSGPFIKFLSPEEYALRKEEREEAARLKKEADEIAYKPVKKVDFGIGRNYHGTSNVVNLTIKPDLADDYSSGTDTSHSSDTPKKKTKKVTKKVVVKKVVKKVMKKKPKEGGTTEKPEKAKETYPNTPMQASKPKAEPPSPPVKVIQDTANDVDDDDLTMNTLSPDHKIKPKIPPSALDEDNSDETSCSESSEDITLAHLVDFDGMEGVKGLKKSNH
mmetsp:Transcript_11599/g.22228  ORF Transcript_11599/g.22228 Transcript_11599/m.22228 type:complete len:505 (-) Transcript_11599:113-1627(-)|eukprot:scaffold4975_cov164-Amphora_coffeaeformis.AAC.3